MTAIGYAGGDPTKVNKAGDTMTGLLLLSGDPVSGLGAATKQYTDSHGGGGGAVTSVNAQTGAVDIFAPPISAAANSAVVHNTGAENVGGIKTFTSVPVLPAGSYGGTGNSAVGDAAAAGTATTLSHSDHVHGREGFGAVTSQTTYGAASVNGTATTVSHSDHTHGTPALTTPGAIGAVATTDYTAYTNFGSLVNVTLGATLAAQYRNEPGTVTRLHGTLTVGAGGILANTVFANIGAGSRPNLIPFLISLRVTGSGANNFLTIALNGDVSYKAALTAGDVLQFDGITYEHA